MEKKKVNYKDPYGTWHVTTQGDCEGRSTRDLGTYIGYVDDIALFLADECVYNLNIEKVSDGELKAGSPTKDSVNIYLEMPYEERKKIADFINFGKHLLLNRETHAEKPDYGMFKISREISKEEKKNIVIEKMKALGASEEDIKTLLSC